MLGEERFCCVWKPGYLYYMTINLAFRPVRNLEQPHVATSEQAVRNQTSRQSPLVTALSFSSSLFCSLSLLCSIYTFAFMLFESVLHAMETAAGNADEHLWAAFCWIRALQESSLASPQPGQEHRVGAKGFFPHWFEECWM